MARSLVNHANKVKQRVVLGYRGQKKPQSIYYIIKKKHLKDVLENHVQLIN